MSTYSVYHNIQSLFECLLKCIPRFSLLSGKNVNPKSKGVIDHAVENETHVNVFASTFRDISQWRQRRLGGLRILAGLLKPFGAAPY